MKIEKLMDAIGAIAPEYVEEAELWNDAAARSRNRVNGYARWRKILLPLAACLALVVVGGTARLWYLGNAGGTDGSAPDSGGADISSTVNEAADMEMAAGSADTGNASDGGAVAEQGVMNDSADAAGESLIVNEAYSFSVTIADHATPADEKYFTLEELQDYYGIRILPEELPSKLAFAEELGETPYVIGYDEDGAVMDDNCKLVFSDVDAGRELEIAARTIDVGEMRSFEGPDHVPSYFYGQEVVVAGIGNEYLAIYERNGVTVTVWSRKLSEDELRVVLEGLLGSS